MGNQIQINGAGLIRQKGGKMKNVIVDCRDCLHDNLFLVKNKRGDSFIYCCDCFAKIRPATQADKLLYRKGREKHVKTR